MARKKNSRALFELISKNKEKRIAAKLGVPEWMGKGQPPPLLQQAPPAAVAIEAEAKAGGQPPPPLPATARRPRKAEPFLALEDNRLKLSLSFLTATVAGVGMLVLLLGSFWLGRYTAPSSANELAGTGSRQSKKDNGSRKDPDPGENKVPVRPVPITPVLQPGKFYLVIQTLMGSSSTDLADARKIQEFWDEKGLPAKVMSYTPRPGSRPRYMVWSLKPFTLAETTGDEARSHARQVEELGKEYARKSSGRYSFNQGRDPQGRPEGWFLPFRQARQP